MFPQLSIIMYGGRSIDTRQMELWQWFELSVVSIRFDLDVTLRSAVVMFAGQSVRFIIVLSGCLAFRSTAGQRSSTPLTSSVDQQRTDVRYGSR